MSVRPDLVRQRGGEAVKPASAAARRLSSPVLVGREAELGLLLEAATQSPALVLLEGEAGIGKTRLVGELLARPELARRQRLVGGCQQVSELFLLGPLVEALREASFAPAALSPVAGTLRALLPELANRLPEPPPPLGDRRAERHRLFRAVRELLGALGPTLLVLEDLHWADATTIEVLRFLAPQPPPELTLVCTYRREDLPDGSPLLGLTARLPREARGVVVPLETLGRDGVRDLVARIMDVDDVSDEFVAQLSEDSGGLPFAVEEILRLLRERRDVIRRRGVWVRAEMEEIRLPVALSDAILERVGGLGGHAQRLLDAAAVLGADSTEDVLVETARLDGALADGALKDVLASSLLLERQDGRYGFRHVLTRQAVHDAIATPVRRRLHLRAAAALEAVRPTPHARLADHYKAAGRTKEWIHHAEAAADRAESLEDDGTAYRFLKEVVAVPGLSAATRARLGIKLALHARNLLALEEAIGTLRTLVDDEKLPQGTRGEVRLWLAKLLISAGELGEAAPEAARALEELRPRPALAASAMLCLAVPWGDEERLEERRRWLDLAVSTVARTPNHAAKISVAGHKAAFLLQIGHPEGWQAADEIPAPGPAASEIDVAGCACVNLADAALQLGYLRRGSEIIAEGRRLLDQIGHSEAVLSLRITALQRDWLVGDWTDLDSHLLDLLDDCEDAAKPRAVAQAALGLLQLARGEVQPADSILERLLATFKGEPVVLTRVRGGLARLRLAAGDPEGAVEQALLGLELVERNGVWAWAADVAPMAVEALTAAGRRQEAEELVGRFDAGLRGRDAPAAAAALLVCRALLHEAGGRRDRAARTFLAAERAWQALPRPYEAARAREGAGRCLLTERAERGTRLLGEAMDGFRGLGASWDAARVRHTLREHGAIPPHRRGRKSYGNEPSPREAEVAALASDGLSNREIALTLFLSQKTVEGHLRSTMRKLGVKSRTDLPAELREAAGANGAPPTE